MMKIPVQKKHLGDVTKTTIKQKARWRSEKYRIRGGVVGVSNFLYFKKKI